MPRPVIVKKTKPLPPVPAQAAYVGRPEHNFRLSLEEWEMTVFDNAINFVVASFRGRGHVTRQDFGLDFASAVAACEANERACLYACTESGRFVCLERKIFAALQTRFSAKNSI